jgi:hypothetical protein
MYARPYFTLMTVQTMPALSRRMLLRAVGACLVMNRFDAVVAADAPGNAKLAEAAGRGRRFLESLFDPTLELLPEYRGAKVYWLFHDNYLASKVLARANPALADKITAAIRGFGIDHSGKIETLFGEAKHPLPFRQYDLIEVRTIGEKVVKTEVVKETVLKDWREYADLLFLAAIAESDKERARQCLDDGLKLWDGTGFKDRAVGKQRQYATYKLALSLIAVARLDVKVGLQAAILEQLLALQGKDGGWITDFDERRKPVGLANVETTCLAILGLEASSGAK